MAPQKQIKSLKERIKSSDKISEPDKEALLQFDKQLTLLNSEYSDYRHAKLLRHVTIMSEKVGGVSDALTDKEAAEDIVTWINQNYDNEETNQDYRVALKVFGRKTSEENGGEPPDSLDWIPSGTSSNYDPAPEPAKMLEWETDIKPMIENTEYTRNKAAIALQFDAGLRGFEFRDITVGDITDHKHGLQVTVDGKQGRRTVLLVPSVPYVNEWLDEHPAADNDEAPLWSKLDKPEGMSYRMLTKMFRKPAKRAEISKPVTLTNFRKSSASYYASKGMNQAHLEKRYGWVTGSEAASRYIQVFADEAEREVARIHGKEVEEKESDNIGPIQCPRCEEENARENRFCMRCGMALDRAAAAELESKNEQTASVSESEDVEMAHQVAAQMIENPEYLDEILELLSDKMDQDSVGKDTQE